MTHRTKEHRKKKWKKKGVLHALTRERVSYARQHRHSAVHRLVLPQGLRRDVLRQVEGVERLAARLYIVTPDRLKRSLRLLVQARGAGKQSWKKTTTHPKQLLLENPDMHNLASIGQLR